MQTLVVGLLAGLIVGVICLVYVFLRTNWVVSHRNTGDGRAYLKQGIPTSESQKSTNLMFMVIIASASLIWGFLGAGVYHVLGNDLYFITFSAILATLVNVYIVRSKTNFARDKMVLSAIIIIGLGFLIPWMI